MKKRMKFTLALITSVLFLMVVSGLLTQTFASEGKKYELKFQCQYPEKHYSVRNAIKPWFKEVENKSNGRLKLHFFTQRTIVKEEETFEAIKNGLLDMGSASTGRTPGKFPLMDIVTMPLLFPNSETASVVLWELYKRYPELQKEFKGTKLMFLYTSAQVQINTRKKPVKTLEDLKGLKLIGWIPPWLNLIKALGANPIQLPPMDTYLALQRGMADGVATPYAPLKSLKISEVVKYHTTADLMVLSFFCAANPAKFDSLPQDIQKVLLDTTGDKMSRTVGKSLDDAVAEDVKWMQGKGNQFYTLPPQEKARWAEKIKPLREGWLKKMESKGYSNIREMLDTTEKLVKQHQ